MLKQHVLCAIAFNWHDSAVSYAIDNEIVLVLEAERFFRTKKKLCSAEEMERLVGYGLHVLGLSIEDVEFWSLSSLNNPWLSFDQIQSLGDRDYYWDDVSFLDKRRRCLIVSHHYAHAAAYFASDYDKAIVQTCDGGGDFNERVATFIGQGETLERVETSGNDEISALPYSLISGFFYRDRFCEGKMMALSAFGDYDPVHASLIHDALPLLNDWGSGIQRGERPEDVHKKFLAGSARADVWLERNLAHLFSAPGRFTQGSLDFIATFQTIFIDRRTADIQKLVDSHRISNVVLGGGACLNLAANTSIHDRAAEDLFILPNCDDSGQSFGALCTLIILVCGVRPLSVLPFLGMGEGEVEMRQVDLIADLLFEGKTIFLHNGKAELGPRALGHRSIIAKAGRQDKKVEISEGIKEREPYRPVAPITTDEALSEYFEGPATSPYMLHSYNVRPASRHLLSGVTHLDGTARAQSVSRQSDPFMHELLTRYQERSGVPVLLNTSLNLKGDPISNDIEQTLQMAEICRKRGIEISVVHNGTVLI